MKKGIIISISILSVILLSGCSSGSSTSTDSIGSVWRSKDGGESWNSIVKTNNKGTISSANILSMAVDSSNSQIVFLGTEKDGIFKTKNGGDEWVRSNLALGKVYGLAVDSKNDQIVYVGGVFGKRGKILKSENGGDEWKEIYSEPADGTAISSLEISKIDSQVLYAGTDEGMIFKTVDGGGTWKNLSKGNGPIIEITFDPVNDSAIYFGVFNEGIIRTRDQGKSFESLNAILKKGGFNTKVNSIAIDQQKSGVVYVGVSDGIIKGTEYGNKWTTVNILGTSRKFPIRSIAVNPQNSNEIIYNSAQAIYKSVDGGIKWSTNQSVSGRIVEIIKYDPTDTKTIFLGLRKM
jgi:photosystem II stability/assembly factor-like uncharacterized protein